MLQFCIIFVIFYDFFILNLINADWTLSQIYLSVYDVLLDNMRANGKLLILFFLIILFKRILREELHHTAVKRRLLTYAQTAECHLLRSRYERR